MEDRFGADRGYSPDKRGKVFPDFKDPMTPAPLKNWLREAGIIKHISYHCSRHSFACHQLDKTLCHESSPIHRQCH
nr:hypothetical protein [uncultured Prevotella sp.]